MQKPTRYWTRAYSTSSCWNCGNYILRDEFGKQLKSIPHQTILLLAELVIYLKIYSYNNNFCQNCWMIPFNCACSILQWNVSWEATTELLHILNSFFIKTKIQWENCVRIAQMLLEQCLLLWKLISVCEAKIAKVYLDTLYNSLCPGLNNVFMSVVNVMNYIKMRPLKLRPFSALCIFNNIYFTI